MLKNAAPLPYSRERCGETPFVIASHATDPSRWAAVPVAAPPFTGRMRYNRAWPRIEASIPILVPNFYPINARIGAIGKHEKRGNLPGTSRLSRRTPPRCLGHTPSIWVWGHGVLLGQSKHRVASLG